MKFPRRARPGTLQLVARAVYALLAICDRARRGLKGMALVGRFADHGDDFVFDPDGTYSYESIRVGDNVDLGYRPILIAARSTIQIGSNVMFGPEVTIRGGNHRFDLPGIPMIDVGNDMKLAEHDRGVVIEDDVWIGTRSIILHGVTIGRGSVIGAGSVVTKSVPEFTIAAGVPARVIRDRFTPEQHADHLACGGEIPHGEPEGAN